MKHYVKFITIFSLILLLTMAVAGAASADVLRGKGWLRAQGSGFASLHMTGQTEITGHGVGVVYIYGARSITAEGDGHRIDRDDGAVIFRGYSGKIDITGERMIIKMAGSKIDFRARGKGKAVLKGRGVYQTKQFTGDWAPDGLTLEMEEE